MASTLPTPSDCACNFPDNGCCTDDCVEIIINEGGSGGGGISTHGVGDLNILGLVPPDPTIWSIGLEHVGSVTGPISAVRYWNPNGAPGFKWQ